MHLLVTKTGNASLLYHKLATYELYSCKQLATYKAMYIYILFQMACMACPVLIQDLANVLMLAV